MSVFTAYKNRRYEISTGESVGTLDHMMGYFGDGERWAQGVYTANDGGRCLVSAAQHVRVSQIDDAKHWLRMAIKKKTGIDYSIEAFNDTRSSFEEIKEIIELAKELARAGANAGALVGEVLPPVRLALPGPAPVSALPAVQANRLPVPASPWAAPVPAAPAQRKTGFFSALFGDARPSLQEWRD